MPGLQCPRCAHINPAGRRRCDRCGANWGDLETDAPRIGLGVGAVLDNRYRVEGLIGRGGMAEVYAAADLRLGRRVALKVLSSELINHPTARQRMENEAVKLAQVRHPNVIEIHSVFDYGGLLVLDLELATGGTLASRIPSTGVPFETARRAVDHILSGLGAIHQPGLVHRDLKPANVLVTADEVFKIADLGVARDPGRQATRTGARIGTPTYMSPEQVRGQRDVDRRSDIYSAGVLFFELLSGAVPFPGDSEFDVMAAHVSAPPELRRLQGKAPPHAIAAIDRALAKDPDQRFRTAEEFRGALLDAYAPVEVRAQFAPSGPIPLQHPTAGMQSGGVPMPTPYVQAQSGAVSAPVMAAPPQASAPLRPPQPKSLLRHPATFAVGGVVLLTAAGLGIYETASSHRGPDGLFSRTEPRIRGVVRGVMGEPLADVVVTARGQAHRTTTDADGRYRLEYTPGKVVVSFNKDGFAADPLTFELSGLRPVDADPVELYPIPRDDDPFIYAGGRLVGLIRREAERVEEPQVLGVAPKPRGAKPWAEAPRVGIRNVKDIPKASGKVRLFFRVRRGFTSPSAVETQWAVTRLSYVDEAKVLAPALGPTAAVRVKIGLHVADKDQSWRARGVPADDPQVLVLEADEQPSMGVYSLHEGVLRAERPIDFTAASRDQLRPWLFEVDLAGYSRTPDRFPDSWRDASGARVEAYCTVTASSILSAKYIPRLLRDGRMDTGWCEDEKKGPGLGEWVKFEWSDAIAEDGVWLTPGWFRGQGPWRRNNRIREARFETSTGESKVESFADEPKPVRVRLKPGFRWVKLTIVGVYPHEQGGDDDTCISEISPARIPEQPLPP
jgi:tRNA A-37 threonylcarbamoyl transferase component Bud32